MGRLHRHGATARQATPKRPRYERRRSLLARGLVLCSLIAIVGCALAVSAGAESLPDGRAYELVTPGDMNGVTGSITFNTPDGKTVDWSALGGCCGSTTGAEEFFQSRRGSSGWNTRGLTPTPSRSLEGFLEPQAPVFWSRDLATTIFNTPESYNAADTHPGTLNLYAVGEVGPPIWLSQGPLSAGAAPFGVTFDGADPAAKTVVFSTRARLTEDATGFSEAINTPPEYLYARDVAGGMTSLVNVDNNGTVVDPFGATLGDGNFLGQGVVAPDQLGTTTNAVSGDGSKVFFESPPSGLNVAGPEPQPHLYMRDLVTRTTTPLDAPASSGFARYEGASEDGSLVFFTSNEGLAGGATDLELYEFNTTAHAIGPAPAMSAIPVSGGDSGQPPIDGHLLGASAIANDGSHVYFVAEAMLTSTANGVGRTAQANEPNLYVFDTATGHTGFLATLGASDISREGRSGALIQEPDVTRPAVPTPDGSVLAFESKADLTGANPEGPTTVLTSESLEEASTITVASTKGLVVGRQMQIGAGLPETVEIESIPSETEVKLATPLRASWDAGTPATQLSVSDIYRYSAADGALLCVSCTAPGVAPTGPSLLTGMGGSYAPSNQDATMSADGSRIFFMSVEKLVPEDESPQALNVYEWENGKLSLISDGHSPDSAFVFGTTPSGNDVFFATAAQLVPEATRGYIHTYDARIGGGFPTSVPPPEPCSGIGCRSSLPAPGPPTIPASATLKGGVEPVSSDAPPAFRVAKISAAQRTRFAHSGHLTMTISTLAPERIAIRALAKLRAKPQVVASASVSFSGKTRQKQVTLRLSQAGRARLAGHSSLALSIELLDTAGGEVQILRLNLASTRSSSRAHASAGAVSFTRLSLQAPTAGRLGLLTR